MLLQIPEEVEGPEKEVEEAEAADDLEHIYAPDETSRLESGDGPGVSSARENNKALTWYSSVIG